MSTAGVQMAVYLDLQLQTAGKVKGDSTTTSLGRKDQIECWSFAQEVTAPRDVSTGQATGRRRQGPCCITTPVGTASAILFQAIATNETVVKATFRFFQHDRAGKEREYYNVVIEDGTICQMSTHLPSTKLDLASHDEYHKVEFTFRKITINNLIASNSAVDDWMMQNS